MAETSPPCSLGCAGHKVSAQQTLAGWPSVKCEVKTEYWWRDGKTLRVRTWIPNVALPPKSSVRAIFTQRAPSLQEGSSAVDRRCVAKEGRRGFSSLLQYPAPKSGPHSLQILHHFRAPTPSPGPGTRARPGPLLHSQGVGTVNCPQRRRAVPPPPGALRPPPSASPAQLRRHGHPIHPAAVPANHRAPMAPHLAMGRGRARRALSSSPRPGSCWPGSFPGSDQPPPLGDPAGTWVGVRRRRAALLGRWSLSSEGSQGLGGRMESGPDLAAASASRETLDPFLGVEHGHPG